MPKELDKELAATVILEACYTTDEKAAARHGVSIRSLQRWRRRFASDPVLAGIVATKKKALDQTWAEEMPVALRKAIRFIGEACDVADKRNPAVISAIAGALKVLAEALYTGRVIDARIAALGDLPLVPTNENTVH
jgi:hypothetical protein